MDNERIERIKDSIEETNNIINNLEIVIQGLQEVKDKVKIKDDNKTPMIEIEYPFKTESGKYFQPRARRIFAKEDEISQ